MNEPNTETDVPRRGEGLRYHDTGRVRPSNEDQF
jgi:hypothetical protein